MRDWERDDMEQLEFLRRYNEKMRRNRLRE